MGRALVLLACCTCAFALNPELSVSQYAHKAWTIRDGAFKTRIMAIAQTPDGYLWLGTEFGLLRFDGIRATPWEPPRGRHLESGYIRCLLTARDGTLWIGTLKELASWKDGKLTRYPEFAGRDTYSLLEDREGSIWAGGYEPSNARICAIQKSGVRCYGEKGEFETGVQSFHEDRTGNLWASVLKGVWRLKPGPPQFFRYRVIRSEPLQKMATESSCW